MTISLRHHLLSATAMLLLVAADWPAVAADETVVTPAPVKTPAVTAPAIPSDEEWHALRTTIETALAERIKQEVAAAVTEQAVAQELKLGWPVKTPLPSCVIPCRGTMLLLLCMSRTTLPAGGTCRTGLC